MFVDFNSLSPSARIWIYQSETRFTSDEEKTIRLHLTDYCERWAAHGQPLKCSFDIRFAQIVILAVDESFNTASGCSIDDSVRAIKTIEQQTNLNFFNRQLVPFVQGDSLFLIELGALKEKFRLGIWNERSLTLNNLASSKSQLQNEWIIPAGSTWLKRYVPAQTINT